MANTAPLEAVYASCAVALPTRATTEAVLITDAFVFLWRRNDRIACLHPNQTPFTCNESEPEMINARIFELRYINIVGHIPDFLSR